MNDNYQPTPDDHDEADMEEVFRSWRRVYRRDRSKWRQWFPYIPVNCYPGPRKWSPTQPFPNGPIVAQFGTPPSLQADDDNEELGDLLAGQPDVPASPPPLNLSDRNQRNWRWQ